MRAYALPEVFNAYPGLGLLAPHPPPIAHLKSLTEACKAGHRSDESAETQIYVYRDDLCSTLTPGGNKLRKLEYALPLALKKTPDATALIAVGGMQSNCCRQAAQVAVKLGLKCYLLLCDLHDDDSSMPDRYRTGANVQLAKLLGAAIRVSKPPPPGSGLSMTAAFEQDAKALQAELEAQGERVVFIPTGASKLPGSGLGYARFAFEMLDQERRLGEDGRISGTGHFDVVVVATASGSTLAGMIAGFKLALATGYATTVPRVIGAETFNEPVEKQRQNVLEIARDTAEMLGLDKDDISLDDVQLDGRWGGGTYGHYDAATRETVHLAAHAEALMLDPVYTGKGMTAVRQGIARRELQGNILFVHTGGETVLSVYED